MKPAKPINQLQFPLHMGNEQVFDLVFRTYHHALCLYAERFVPDYDAGDLVENLFVALWKKNQQMLSEAHLKNYLYLSMRNRCLTYQTKRKNEASRYEKVMADTDLTEQSHQEQIITAEVWAELYRAIHHLPTQCGTVIRLAYIDGKSNGEIAGEMGLSEQTVKNHKLRGIKILRQYLSDETLALLLLLSIFR